MLGWLITIYALLFAFLTWRRFDVALAIFFFALPSYLIRFNVGHLPTTLLEMMFGIITIDWVVRYHKRNMAHGTWNIRRHKTLFCAIALFLLAATVSVFNSTHLRAAMGEWKTFYVEPIVMFLIIVTMSPQQFNNLTIKQSKNFIIFGLVAGGLVTSLLAIYQHFTGWMVPEAFWANQNTYRATAWYGFPNAVGLFLAPIIPFAVYSTIQTWKKIQSHKLSVISHKKLKLTAYGLRLTAAVLTIPASIFAIYFAKSTGALIGLAAGLLFFLFFYNKKSRLIVCLVSLVGIVSLVSLPTNNPVKQELLLQDRSGQIRLGIWNETWEFLKDNPILGAGLASYQEKIKPYHTTVNNENIEIFHHPHNIFLTMWVNLGLMGLIGFILIIIWFFKTSWNNLTILHPRRISLGLKQFNNSTIYLASSMVVILVAGLVDSPYIKNDLAMLFWLLPALLILQKNGGIVQK
ncbi:MAG: O-antigen ligase family protein [Candidatus Magasanikbacteria bacterium]|nr:O-antigen ligase family protein [Candidatus Magasanikbacteria bacterium]